LVGLQGFNSDGSLRYCRGLNWDEFLKWDGNRQMKFCLTNRSSVRTTDDLPLRDDEKTESYKLCWNGKGGDR
jgi:hypothetical protein